MVIIFINFDLFEFIIILVIKYVNYNLLMIFIKIINFKIKNDFRLILLINFTDLKLKDLLFNLLKYFIISVKYPYFKKFTY